MEKEENKKSMERKESKTGLIIGIIIGAVIVILLIVIIVLLIGKGNNNSQNNSGKPNNINTVNVSGIKANSYEELEKAMNDDIDKTTSELKKDFDTLSAGIKTYDDYVKKAKEVEDYYDKVVGTTKELDIRMREYALKYVELILKKEKSYDDKYDAMKDMEKAVYDKGGDKIEDAIYDDLGDDCEDAFYEGVLDDQPDSVSYSDWYDVRSDEYSNWYDMRSDVYSDWYDMRSEIYSFYYDVAGKLYSKDEDGVQKKIDDFKEDIEKLKK